MQKRTNKSIGPSKLQTRRELLAQIIKRKNGSLWTAHVETISVEYNLLKTCILGIMLGKEEGDAPGCNTSRSGQGHPRNKRTKTHQLRSIEKSCCLKFPGKNTHTLLIVQQTTSSCQQESRQFQTIPDIPNAFVQSDIIMC